MILREDGHGVDVVLDVVHQHQPREVGEAVEHLFLGAGLLELDVDGLAVTVEDGDAHRGGGDPERLIVQYLLGLLDHLPLLFGIAVVEEDVDVREHVERDWVGELLGSLPRDAVLEVVVSRDARARDRLIGGVDDALDAEGVIERFERHHRLDGGAVGVGDDALVPLHVLGIDLGDDEGDVVVHAPLAAVVHDHRARLDEDGSEFRRSARTRGEESKVHLAFQSHHVLFRELDDGVRLAHEVDLLARASCGSEEIVVLDGELSFGQHFEELVADHAGRADDGDVEFFHITSCNPLPFILLLMKSICLRARIVNKKLCARAKFPPHPLWTAAAAPHEGRAEKCPAPPRRGGREPVPPLFFASGRRPGERHAPCGMCRKIAVLRILSGYFCFVPGVTGACSLPAPRRAGRGRMSFRPPRKGECAGGEKAQFFRNSRF